MPNFYLRVFIDTILINAVIDGFLLGCLAVTSAPSFLGPFNLSAPDDWEALSGNASTSEILTVVSASH